MDFSVIICAYTEKRYVDILEAVESLRKQEGSDPEVILVVDRNKQLFERLQKENIADQLLFSENPGLSAGRNVGIKKSQGEFIAFLDDDAIADPNWISVLTKLYDDKNVFGAGGKIVPIWFDSSKDWFPEEIYWVIGCTYNGIPNEVMQVRNTFGSNISFRKRILKEVLFDDSFGRVDEVMATGEETELCIKIRNALPGMYFMYDPMAVVGHKIFPERTSLGYSAKRGYGEGLSKKKLKKKHGEDKDVLESESSYLENTVFPLFTELRLETTYFKKLLYVSTVVLSFAAGYMLGRGK